MITYKIGKELYNMLLDIQEEKTINNIIREILMILGIMTFCIVTIATFILDLILFPMEIFTFVLQKI